MSACQRLKDRAEQLRSFHASFGRLPSPKTACLRELGLFMFLRTLRSRYREGALEKEVVCLLEDVPGALRPPPAGKVLQQGPTPRSTAFERWLVRAEEYAECNGYRPTFNDDNALYQWLNRARRKLEAGELDEPFAGRVRAVLEFPDIRTYRYRAAHGLPASPGGSGA